MIKNFEQFTNESVEGPAVYVQQNNLWWATSPGSGMTTYIKGDPDKFRGYFTNDPGEVTYDYNVNNILKWSRTQPSISSKNLLYKIPAYWGYKDASELSVWGGSIKPDYFLYLLLSTYRDKFILSLFKTKKEALDFAGK